jgi:hypothetical protein
MRKPGTVAPLVYFRYPNGHLTLAPFTDCPTPDGAIREEVDTLISIDKVVDILRRQEADAAQREMRYDMALTKQREQEIRDRIYQRISSSATTEYEREFLRLYVQLRDERKRELYRQRFMEAQWYLHARENDLGDREADKEMVNLDKVNF